MQSLSSQWYAEQHTGESPTSWEPLFRADAGVFCCTLKGNKHPNQRWASLFTPVHHKGADALNIKPNTRALLSHKTHGTWLFLGNKSYILKCTMWGFCTEHRLFVLVRMSCLTGQSWHETRKRDVVSVRRGLTGCEPQACRGCVTGDTEDSGSKRSSTETFVSKIFVLNISLNTFIKQSCTLHSDVPSRLGAWIDFLCYVYRLLLTHKHINWKAVQCLTLNYASSSNPVYTFLSASLQQARLSNLTRASATTSSRHLN